MKNSNETLPFKPPKFIQNADLQTILSSLMTDKLGKYSHLKNVQKQCIQTDNFGTLTYHHHLSLKAKSKQHTVILLHGWEGSNESGYILRTTQTLLKHDLNVIRLNFRDHGDHHHLNQQPFNSARLFEVKEAISLILNRYRYESFDLIGFSLGGNFAIRLASEHDLEFKPKHLISICPPIDPLRTSYDIEEGWFVYHNYFVKKWHRSLKQKLRYYPELVDSIDDLYKHPYKQSKPTLNELNDIFVPKYTGYDEVETYFNAYKIDQHIIDKIECLSCIIYAEDDPIIQAEQFEAIEETKTVYIRKEKYGGHCAFISDLKMNSWLDAFIIDFL